MNYRPMTDVWILGRAKTGYYGSYPAGFLARARNLLGVGRSGSVLHVCSGAIKDYKCGPTCRGRASLRTRHFHGFSIHDRTLDLNPNVEPDYLQDARDPFPVEGEPWDAVLIDRPYSEADADMYIKHGLIEGRTVFPSVNLLLRNGLAVVPVGGKVGILDYKWPSPPKHGKEIALVGVGIGRKSNARWYTVFERTE